MGADSCGVLDGPPAGGAQGKRQGDTAAPRQTRGPIKQQGLERQQRQRASPLPRPQLSLVAAR